jgi:beta-lactamase regulating signal transducer with metallopeptidase domain/outer membrane biosynthesis protein TonB
MSDIFTATNVLSYAIQVAGLVIVGAVLPRLLRVTSPRGRLVYFRALLIACFLLPILQPWRPAPQATATAPAPAVGTTPAMAPIEAPPGNWTDGLPALPARPGWPLPSLGLTIAAVAGCGIVLRFAWLGLGLSGLSRLKRTAPKLAPRPSAVDAAVALVGTDADIRVTSAVQAPVTFGMHSPVVLLPKEFPAFDAAQQQAIVCHELLHVRRRDWRATVLEEAVRSLTWFHPALWWLIDQTQLAREQVVDDEVVRAIGSRDPYLDALLRLVAPAPQPAFRPATLFLRKTHLAQRIALLLKEGPMSRPRLAVSLAVMTMLVVGAGGLLVHGFPLRSRSMQPTPIAARVVVTPLAPAPTVAPSTPTAPAFAAAPAATPVAPPVAAATVAPDVRQSPPATQTPEERRAQLSTIRRALESGPWPKAVRRVNAPYPPDALAAGTGGRILVVVDVQPDGRVTNVALAPRQPLGATSVPPLLGEAAIGAARQFLFEPRPATFEQFGIVFEFDAATGTTSTMLTPQPPPPPPPTQGPVKRVDPVYPPDARARNITGMVVLHVSAGPTGQVLDVEPEQGPLMFVPAAVAAVRQWQYMAPGTAIAVVCFFVDENGEYVGRSVPPRGYRPPAGPQPEREIQPTLPPGFTGAPSSVVLRVTIGDDGSVTDVVCPPGLDPAVRAAAIAAARATRYSPPYVAPYVLAQVVRFTVPK